MTYPAGALDPDRSLDQYGYQLWQTDSGLPQNTIHSILQTQDGYLWLGTEGGVVRFDGIRFVTFDVENTPQLKSNIVNDLFEDRAGALWISTSAGLVCYRAGEFTSYTTAGGLPSETVWFTGQDRAGRIWAFTANGPAFLNASRFHTVPAAQAAAPESRRAVAESDDGTLWLGSASGLFALHVGEGADPSLARHLLSGIRTEALAIDHAGNLWAGTRQGLERYSHTTLEAIPIAGMHPQPEVTSLCLDSAGGLWAGTAAGLAQVTQGKAAAFAARSLDARRIEGLFEDHQGALWIANGEGAARLVGNQLQSFPAGSRLATGSVLSLFEDREGDLWIGTDASGLSVLRDQKFTTYTARDGLSGDLIRCVFQDQAGTIWIGTNGGGLNRRTANGFTTLTTRDGLSSNIIFSMAGSPNGDLWIGTPDGLNLLHQGRIRRFTSADGLPDDFIRSLYADRDGSLWIGTPHGLAHLAAGRIVTYSAMDGLGSDFIGAILRARSDGPDPAGGDLWIGTSGGLSRLRHGAFTNYTVHDGLSNNIVTTIHQDSGGSLWLGTNGGGLDRLLPQRAAEEGAGSKQKIQSFPAGADGLPDTIYGILEDAAGNLWLSSRTGIFRVARSALDAFANGSAHTVPVSAYGAPDGMKIRECSGGGHPSAWKMNDGSLWFATLEGVSSIDPARAQENRLPPPVAIEALLIDDRPASLEEAVTVKPGANRLEFQYAGLSFVAPQKVRYRYRLFGFDRGWIDAGTRRAAFYTNLPPGEYRFQVLAANNDGVWNEAGAALALRIEPHFYQTLWFYSALVLAVLLLAALAYRWRVRQVESGWSAVLAERSRLAREIHDTLAQGYVGISVQLELLSRLLGAAQEPARQQLDETRALVRSSLAEARTSIWQLRSQNTAQDLPARLAHFCGSAAHSSPAKVYLQVKGTYHPLDRAIENELQRIGQEAVLNALRHAEATRIDVQLIYDGTRVCLKVNDNGRGFPVTEVSSVPAGHFGLQGMRERAAQIGAVLIVESQPGKGTQICVELARG